MEPKVLIYLVIGIVYLYAQYKKGQKKREQQNQQHRQQDSTSTSIDRPIQPPTPEKDRDIFKNIFEDAQDQLKNRREEERKKVEPAKRFAPEPRKKYELLKPAKEELDENYADTSMQDMMKYETPRALGTSVAAATVNYEDDLTNPILDNFELRNALIAQIILERPEF